MLQLVWSLSNKPDFSSLKLVAGSSVVIKMLGHSCQTILTVTDLIIDGCLVLLTDPM